MKTILVTGCAGFIGFNLAKRLLENRHYVIGIDDLSTGSQKNLTKLKEYPQFYFKDVDLSEVQELISLEQSLLHDYGYRRINEIYHAASPASPPKYNKLPFKTIWVNTKATQTLCRVALRKNAKFMFFSTSETYGDPQVVPQNESYRGWVNTIGPRSIYDESKRLGETITYEYHRRFGLDVKIPRIHNTYGPGMNPHDGRVITNFIKQGLQGREYTIYGDGQQLRCLTYIDDMVDSLIRLMDSDIHEPINLGSNNYLQVKQIAYKIHKLIYSKDTTFPHVFYPLPEDDPVKRIPDLTKAKNELGWQPTTSLQNGFKKTIEYVKQELENES